MADHAQVLTAAAASEEEAERLARSITTARLAACVHIVGPIRSMYWWHGAGRATARVYQRRG